MKKYLFIIMIINIFFITNVYGLDIAEVNNQTYINLNPNNRTNNIQSCITGTGQSCTIQWEMTDGEVTINDDTKNVIVITPFLNINTTGGANPTSLNMMYKQFIRAMVEFYDGDTSYCDLTDTAIICRLNGTRLKGIYVQLINVETYSVIIEQITGRIGTNAIVGYYSNIGDLVSQQQQQHQEIMQNDPTQYNNGIESIAGNTQLPNNSGLFDVLSSLSSFVGNLSASGSCSPILVPIPFTNQNFRLPCMTTEVYAPNFPVILGIYQLIVRGLVYYYIIVNMLKLLKDTIDPFSMKLEVLDL